jgi:cell division protein FtsL
MTRFNLLLLVVLLVSSVYLVRVSYDAHHLYGELDRARTRQRQFETEYGRLQAERQTQAAPARVEKTARDKLRMVQATPAIMKQVTVTADAGQPTSAIDLRAAASQGQR